MSTLTETIIEKEFIKMAGICLLLGALLSTLAMALHPTGADIEHIIKIKNVLAFSHSIAILCLPFIGFGFWGLSKLLVTKSKVSTLAFFIFSFGLFAAMIAATINGLTLPGFASNYSPNENEISTIKKIIDYGKFINIPMAVIFITATSLSIGIWAFVIIYTSKLPNCLGYLGLIIIALGILGVLLKFNFTDLLGFRTFILGLVIWKILTGVIMITKNKSVDYQCQ